jgi:very-short-patch-repair endonuclease
MRLIFPSPTEVKFVEIMGGKAFTFRFLKSPKTGFPFTLLWLGKTLRRELVCREVRIGRYFADYCVITHFYRKVIELDGYQFHSSKMDIVKDQQREDYLHARGFAIYRIPATRLWREPKKVKEDVLRFLES